MSVAVLLLAAAAALAECDALAMAGEPAVACYREVAATSSKHGMRAEALWHSGDIVGANAAFRDATEASPNDADLRARWGRLFLDVHQQADAEALFAEALELEADNVEALLGMAELALGRFEPGVRKSLARVLQRHPRQPDAHLLWARMQLEIGEVDAARARITGLLDDGALEGWHRLDAYALLAAADALRDVAPSPWVERALALNPRFGDVYAVPAEFLVINRRYVEAVAAYERAVAVAPEAWDAHAELGINLLRVNRLDAARRHLERAYEGDPYNALTVNTLRLLDLLDEQFATVEAPGLMMRAPTSQASVLSPYVSALAARARREMSERYGYSPPGPVVVELYEYHDDFAVRTAGLPGLGILGATFGDVVVMDGPAAKRIDDGFDWASALWHELAHVYTLGATGNRVARWFSEGVSVMEEWQHGPSPQRAVPLHFVEAYREDRLLPVAELDQGFLRPRYPQQVAVSYVQAGLLCELIAASFPSGLEDMLAAYARGEDTARVVEQALGITPEALDGRFQAHLKARLGGVAKGLDAFRDHQRAAREAVAAEAWPAAVEAAAAAQALYPEYVLSDGPYQYLAQAAEATDDDALLERTLRDYFARGGRDPGLLRRLAAVLRAAGDTEGELDVLQVAARTVPLNGDLHTYAGERLAAAGRDEEALAHFRNALDLGPHDTAGAQLRLAQTYHRLGRTEAARRALLLALEIAPRYPAALDLLLTINGVPADDGS